jgi:anti-sigma regulatory factor (Ser/Thr protein kinase)
MKGHTKIFKRWTIPADLRAVELLCEVTEELLTRNGFGDQKFGVLLCLREMLNNAVIHGSKCDLEKSITYTFELDDCVLLMTIQDEGPGFDWSKKIRECIPPDSESGRGICICRYYCDFIEYNSIGNEVKIVKKMLGGHYG